jgi:hypothetical protein
VARSLTLLNTRDPGALMLKATQRQKVIGSIGKKQDPRLLRSADKSFTREHGAQLVGANHRRIGTSPLRIDGHYAAHEVASLLRTG